MSTENEIIDDQDFEDVAGEDDGIPDDSEPAKEPIQFSLDVVKRSAERESEIVEVNINTGECRIVDKSKAKRLGKAVMKAKGAPVQTGQTLFDGAVMTVEVYHGKPLALQIAHEQLLNEYENPERRAERDERLRQVGDAYKDVEITDEVLKERDGQIQQVLDQYKDLELTHEQRLEREDRAKRLILAGMIPQHFSYEGSDPNLYPIEDVDELLLDALWTAYLDVNVPLGDAWYQVEVRRGTPIETKLMLGNTFESFPLGKGQRVSEMAEDTLETYLQREDAKRNILVSSMMLKPSLSLNGKGAKNAYPIENLSEQMLQVLHSAYNVVNVPSEGLKMLRMFPRHRRNRKRTRRNAGSRRNGKSLRQNAL